MLADKSLFFYNRPCRYLGLLIDALTLDAVGMAMHVGLT